MIQAHDHLDTSGHPGRCVEMPDVGLHRADSAVLLPLRMFPIHRAEGRQLDRIAQLRPGSMRLDIRDALRVNPRRLQHFADHVRLAFDARRVEADLIRSVVIQPDAPEQGVNVVAVRDRIGGFFQQQHRSAFPSRHAVRRGIERLDVPVAGEIQTGLMHITDTRSGVQRRAPDEGILRLAGLQALIR
ncbi:hypothetical protein D3C71_1123610 [compost metagenome]